MNYFDLHCDTLTKAFWSKSDIFSPEFSAGLGKSRGFENYSQCYGIWLSDELTGESAFRYAESIVEFYKNQLLLFESNNIKNAVPLLTGENGRIIGGNLRNLKYFKDNGIIMMSLTWNGENELAFGAECHKDEHIKALGKDFVRECERLGIVIDVSHLNEQGFYDVINMSKKPVVASHSCCSAIFNHKRNLTDSQLREIIDLGGLIGICFYDKFLGAENGDTFSKIYENIYHVLALGGENAIAFGSDFDGAKLSKTISSLDKIPDLFLFLLNKGLKKDLLNKIFYTNAEKFFHNILQ